jgi:hypothetical protein
MPYIRGASRMVEAILNFSIFIRINRERAITSVTAANLNHFKRLDTFPRKGTSSDIGGHVCWLAAYSHY